MSKYPEAFEKEYIQIKKDEGGYVNDPDDRGGETFRGVSRKSHPNWPGWVLIDNAKAMGITRARDIDAFFKDSQQMEDLVKEVAWENYGKVFL